MDLLLDDLTPLILCHDKGNFDLNPLSIDTLSDKEIRTLYLTSPSADPEQSGRVRRIAHDAVAKSSEDGVGYTPCEIEMQNANFVREHTNIPISKWHRFVKPSESDPFQQSIIVCRHIPGRTLAQCWNSLGAWMQFRVALTLRYYIRQLRSLRSSVPGPVGDGPQRCWGPTFNEFGAGPFTSYPQLSEYYAGLLERTRLRAEAMNKPVPDLTPFDDTLPLVMTHHDLNERNIILGDDNQLWIVDWMYSGYYPEWFEYSSFTGFHGQWFPETGRPDLRRFVDLITGRYDKPGQEPFFRTIYRVLKFDILVARQAQRSPLSVESSDLSAE